MAIEEGHIMTSALILKTDKGLAEIKDKNKVIAITSISITNIIIIVTMSIIIINASSWSSTQYVYD